MDSCAALTNDSISNRNREGTSAALYYTLVTI